MKSIFFTLSICIYFSFSFVAEISAQTRPSRPNKEFVKEKVGIQRPTDEQINDFLYNATGQGNAKTKEQYSFEVAITTQMQDVSKRRPKKQTFTQHYGPGATMMQLEKEQSIITDLNSETIIMMDTKRKTAQIMNAAFMGKFMGKAVSYIAEKNGETGTNPNIKKLNETQVIAGYTAEGYLVSTEDGAVEIWYSKAIPMSFFETTSGFMAKYIDMPTNMEPLGYPLLMTQINKKGKRTDEMRVIEVNKTPIVIDMKDYNVMNIFGK